MKGAERSEKSVCAWVREMAKGKRPWADDTEIYLYYLFGSFAISNHASWGIPVKNAVCDDFFKIRKNNIGHFPHDTLLPIQCLAVATEGLCPLLAGGGVVVPLRGCSRAGLSWERGWVCCILIGAFVFSRKRCLNEGEVQNTILFKSPVRPKFSGDNFPGGLSRKTYLPLRGNCHLKILIGQDS